MEYLQCVDAREGTFGMGWIPVECSSSLFAQLQYSGDSLIVELTTDQAEPVLVREVVLIQDQ